MLKTFKSMKKGKKIFLYIAFLIILIIGAGLVIIACKIDVDDKKYLSGDEANLLLENTWKVNPLVHIQTQDNIPFGIIEYSFQDYDVIYTTDMGILTITEDEFFSTIGFKDGDILYFKNAYSFNGKKINGFIMGFIADQEIIFGVDANALLLNEMLERDDYHRLITI